MLRLVSTRLNHRALSRKSFVKTTTHKVQPLRQHNVPLCFSTFPIRRSKQSSHSEKPQGPPNGNPEMPKFSLDGLGISKNMKMVLIVLVSILGTMETWTYYTWWRNWYYGDNAEKGTESN